MYKNNLLTLTIFLFTTIMNAGFAQNLVIKELCSLDKNLSESSGICTINGGMTFWTMNDSDGKPFLYEIDTNCNIVKSIKVSNAENKDWEEITTDDKGNIYIGDFGNNENSRKDLKIYRIRKEDLLNSNEPSAEIINFNYKNQVEFPPNDAFKNYDMEAMVWLNNKIHLFSKNRTSPFSGYTYHYEIPDTAGNYTLSVVDSFKTGPGPNILYWITGAALSPDGQKLILLSHDRVWLFYPLNQNNFFNSPNKTLLMGHFSQKEGICFADNNNLFLTDERNTTINNGGKLYSSNLTQLVNNNKDFQKPRLKSVLYVKEFLDLDFSPIDFLKVINLEGRIFLNRNVVQDERINLSELTTGLYVCLLKSGNLIERIRIFKE
ncbi:MAG: SdiA-regulated domain-containing protein [Saprospiraceae bacterium]